jgi:hypothetical protein
LSVFAVSLRVFWGTVAALSYMLWRFARRQTWNRHNQKSVENIFLSGVQGFHAYLFKQVIPRHVGRLLTYS